MKELTLRQQRAADTLTAIKDAAERVILREGVMSFTTAQVAQEAHVSIGSVYRYFKNRKDLIDSLVPGFDERATDAFYTLIRNRDTTSQVVGVEQPNNSPVKMYTGILRAS